MLVGRGDLNVETGSVTPLEARDTASNRNVRSCLNNTFGALGILRHFSERCFGTSPRDAWRRRPQLRGIYPDQFASRDNLTSLDSSSFIQLAGAKEQ